jgi:hypothetical protein
MSNLQEANRQWSTRPADERFESLYAMGAFFKHQRDHSRDVVVSTRKFEAQPAKVKEKFDAKGLVIVSDKGHEYAPTHYAFSQVSQLAEARASYLRKLPSPLAADCINWGLKHLRSPEDVKLLLHKNGAATLRAATGPNYGRVWNTEITDELIAQVGDGTSGDWRVPGEFGKAVKVNKENTTLYGSDRDMWVFLADEKNRMEIPNRRQGQPGQLARGFYVWNSEVGDATVGIGSFLFDYACSNRTIWGGDQFEEIKIRHTVSAPDRWKEELVPALRSITKKGGEKSIVEAVRKAQAARLDDVDEFLAKRFGPRQVESIKNTHMQEEGRPIQSLWDVSTALTARARELVHVDARVELERQAGQLLKLAA